MSWNNAHETKLFLHKLMENRVLYQQNGMSAAQIAAIEEYDKQIFLQRRRYGEHITEVILLEADDCDADISIPLSDECDSLELGFADSRLNMIWATADEIDRKILELLSQELKQEEIARRIGISQQAVSKRISRMKKIF